MQHKKILILGVGNILLHDEGVGVKAVAKLDSEYDFSDNVQLFDGGTLGLRLLDPISEADHLIVVDCVRCGHPPGTLYRFTIEDFERRGNFRNSLHQLDLVETLAFAEIIGNRPSTVVVGIEPENISPWGMELTDAVQARLSDMCAQVLEEVTAAGGSFQLRAEAPKDPSLERIL
jgi:hydrogenase maturation protease